MPALVADIRVFTVCNAAMMRMVRRHLKMP
jgi:hypothetical protein